MNKKDEILKFIITYIQDHGYSPSFREIGEGVGLKSMSGVHGYVNQMLKTGMLETDAEERCARALRVPGYRFIKA